MQVEKDFALHPLLEVAGRFDPTVLVFDQLQGPRLIGCLQAGQFLCHRWVERVSVASFLRRRNEVVELEPPVNVRLLLPSFLGHIGDGVAAFLHQQPVGSRLFNRVNILALEVLDELQLEYFQVTHLGD